MAIDMCTIIKRVVEYVREPLGGHVCATAGKHADLVKQYVKRNMYWQLPNILY